MGSELDILNIAKTKNTAKRKRKVEPEVQDNRVPYRPELVQGYEPDFIEGYEIKCGSHTISRAEVLKAVERNDNCLFVGETGTGKSTLGSKILDDLNAETLKENKIIHARNLPLIDANVPANKLEKYHELKFQRVLYNGHIGTRTEHMVGTVDTQYNEQGQRVAVRVPGFLSYSYITEGCKLIWDEMDLTMPEVLGESHAYLDGRSNSIDVFLNGRWKLIKQKHFSVIATANTVGAGENQMDYAGTNVLNKAFLNRFNFTVHLDYLPHDKEVNLISNKVGGIKRAVIETMVAAANKTRSAKKSQAVEYALSTRDIVSWAKACKDDKEQPADTQEYWNKICLKYIYTSFLNRIPEESTREAYSMYFNL